MSTSQGITTHGKVGILLKPNDIYFEHSEWRKLAKKARRKRIRQNLAKIDKLEEKEQKCKEQQPWYQEWIAEAKKREELQAQNDAERAAALELRWQEIEAEAQKQFKELQVKLAAAREERARQNELIKLEWEREQQKLKEKKEKEEEKLQEKIKQQQKLNEAFNQFLDNGGETPPHLNTFSETNPKKELCPFFKKTSTCRFFDVCSRNHIRPGISRIILVPNFFSHYSLEKTETDHFSDSSLEFESSETYADFKQFFYDVLPELEKCGRITLFKTCSNREAHLRGNVYVEYMTKREALICYRALNGRWYGGKQLSVEFCNIESWRGALCGLNFYKRCPKGSACNFLHVFRNPGNLYDKHEEIQVRKKYESSEDLRNCRWSESPERHPNSITEDIISTRKYKRHYDDYDRKKSHDKNSQRRNGDRSRSKSSSKRKRRSRSRNSPKKRKR